MNDMMIKKFVDQLAEDYFINRNIQQIVKFFHKDISWFGTGEEDICIGIEEAKKLLYEEKRKHHSQFSIVNHTSNIYHLDNDFILVNSVLIVKEKSDYNLYDDIKIRASNILKVENEQILLFHVHMSVPNIDQLEDDVLPAKYSSQAPRILEKIVDEKIAELKHHGEVMKMMSDNIPGGMFQVLYDEKLTILEMSEGFLNMFGYTREEIEIRFNNSFLNMIDVRDRARTALEVKKQLVDNPIKIIQYRVTCRDGKTVWVMDKGKLQIDAKGQKYFSCVIIDITESKVAEEELRLSMERHKIILDQGNDIIFEWNTATDEVVYSQNWFKLFKSNPTVKNVSAKLCDNSYDSLIHPDDRHRMKDMIQKILGGQEYTEGEIRIKNSDNAYLWCRFKMTTIFDEAHVPVKTVGVIFNVDDDIRKSQNLLKMAQEDALTKTYNRVTSQNKIIDILEHKQVENAYMLIIDLDDFKIVNDTKGHLFGDAVLSEVAKAMKICFNNNCIVSRVGGDEFLVFIWNEFEDVIILLESFIEKMKCLECNKDLSIPIACSIGVSNYPKDGIHYNELFHKADQSLYFAKSKGKNCYAFYTQENMNEIPGKLTKSMISVFNEQQEFSDEIILMNEKIGEYIFKLLYESIDINNAVSDILEIIGKQFDVSRVYIFENDNDNKHCSNTFEWCNEGIEPQINQLQNISYEKDLDHYDSQFDENGIFYCKDTNDLVEKQRMILENQEVKSLLQCSILDDGEFRGFVGFDECRSNRFWTDEQIHTLKFVSEILSTFLMKLHAKKRIQKEVDNLMEVLNHLDAYVYVVEPHTFKVRFINQKTIMMDPNVKLKDTCYHNFFNLNKPCDNCPLIKLRDFNDDRPVEFYNPKFNLWVSAKPSSIIWEKEQCILLSCFDITQYKQK